MSPVLLADAVVAVGLAASIACSCNLVSRHGACCCCCCCCTGATDCAGSCCCGRFHAMSTTSKIHDLLKPSRTVHTHNAQTHERIGTSMPPSLASYLKHQPRPLKLLGQMINQITIRWCLREGAFCPVSSSRAMSTTSIQSSSSASSFILMFWRGHLPLSDPFCASA